MISLGWKPVVAVLVAALPAVLLAACQSPQVPPAAASSGQPRAITVKVASATVGSTSVTRSYAAIVEARDQVDLAPLARGRVEKLTVAIGSEIKEGQVIAELSHGALDAQLQAAQAELAAVKAAANPNELKARAQLEADRANLNQLLDPLPSDLQVAQSSVATAQSNLDRAKTKLNRLLNPSASDLQLKESAAVVAQSKLDSAKTKLKQLLGPSASDLQVARSAIRTAQSELDSAKTKLQQLLNPTASGIQVAASEAAMAASNLDSANTKLDQLLNPSEADLRTAESAVAQAESESSAAQAKVNQTISKERSASWQALLGARIGLQANRATLENPALNWGLTPEEIADAEQAVAANQEQISILLGQIISAPLLPEDPWNATALIPEEIRTALWTESEALKALETARAQLLELQNPSPESVALARNNVAIAQAALDSARARFGEFQNPSESTAALAQNNVAIAQASLDSAEEKLKELQGPSQSTISLAQNNVAIDKASLDSAEADLKELRNPGSDTVAQLQYEVDVAQAALDEATAELNVLETPRPAELAAAKTAVAVAEQDLALNKETYARHAVQAAQAKVNQIEQQLEERQVLAPFDGLVTQILLSRGAIALPQPQTPIVTFASKDVVVSLRIEQTGVSSFQEEQQVQFTSPGLPTQRVELRIGQIAPVGEQKAHTFSVQMYPVDAVPDLKPGMSGEVSILTRHEGVVLVPKEAVRRQRGQLTLFVVRDSTAHIVAVEGGLIDKKNMEILSGVQPGDQVVIDGQNLLNEGALVTIVPN